MMENNGQKYYCHCDTFGSVVALSDQSGETAESYRYTPFGQVQDAGSLGNPYLFTGRRYDAETGLYYYRARFYHPELRRFMEPDPIGYEDGMNLYAYVLNNPVMYVDPMGLFDVYVIGEVDYERYGGLEGAAGAVYDFDTKEISLFASGGIAVGSNKGAGVGAGFSVRELEGDSTNFDANLGRFSVTVSFDSEGFNGMCLTFGPGKEFSASYTDTKYAAIINLSSDVSESAMNNNVKK